MDKDNKKINLMDISRGWSDAIVCIELCSPVILLNTCDRLLRLPTKDGFAISGYFNVAQYVMSKELF